MTDTRTRAEEPAGERPEEPPGQRSEGPPGESHAEPSAEPPGGSLWHNRDFLRFWFGETLSLLGTQVTNLALPLTAINAFHATDEQVGVLRFLQLVPYLGLALVFGVWVDRARRRRIMLGANLVRMVLLTLVPVLYWSDALDMVSLLVIACAVGAASVLFDVSWMSYVPTLVREPEHYVEAGAKMGMSSSAADVAGPGLAGVLVGALSAPVALIADAFSYLVSLISLLLIRTPEPRPEPAAARRHLPTEIRDGLRWVLKNPVLRSLAVIGFCCNFSMITVWTMFLLYGTRDLRLDSTTLGGIFATASVGGLIGAAISRKVIRRFRLGLVYLVAQSALLVGPTLIVLATGPRWVMVGMFVLSFFTTYLGLGVAAVVIVSLRQVSTPPSMMGRMTAVFRTLLFGGGALGGLFAGLLSGRIGARGALTVAATGSAAVLIALALSPVTRLRGLPPATEEPVAAAN
uniref:Export protein n=1 Tax=Streptomyces rimofaciens TaxID=504097 RepID=H9BDY7_9ACTN|nr:export protein [Streptomyces rimofaciens]